jgi:hypothetical protein
MREGTQIFGRTNQPKPRQEEESFSLGQAVSKFLDEQVSPKQAVYGTVIEIWDKILPAELAKHCRIVDITDGQITVAVDSPSYKYELNLCSDELLKQLRQLCPVRRLKKIKFSTT